MLQVAIVVDIRDERFTIEDNLNNPTFEKT
ncbi:hypothetical protein J2Z42_002029 [Clostridium algifaecis]|uniref:Uncharacterized protein n=1 Tax=Clostridium algifaecis TaxID=1472040 RepID=A0ABS4KV32_9CLOT|nr:hypothetical protein [Clostridium algifaecis]